MKSEMVPASHGEQETDRMLLWLLIALLWKNGASTELMLALAYVAMG